MDFVNKLIEQLRDIFLSMTPGARITAGLLLAVVVSSVAFLFKQSTAGPNELLFTQVVSGKQLAQMQAAIAAKKLGNFREEGGRLYVPRGQRAEYIAAVAEGNALPTDATKLMIDALDGGSVFDSREQKQARLKAAREGQLTYIISQFSWVDQASVLFEERDAQGLHSKPQVSASISVQPMPSEQLTSDRIRSLQQLVAGSHPYLKASQVVITNLSDSTRFGGGGEEVSPEDFESPYYRTRVMYERHVREQVASNLAHVSGVRVQVSAQLEEIEQASRRSVKPEPGGQTVREKSETDDSTQSTAAKGGRVGQFAQGPARTGTDEGEEAQEIAKNTISKTETDTMVGQTEESSVTAGFKPKEVFASVAVPRSYVIDVYKQKKLTLEGKLPEKIDPDELEVVQTDVKTSIEGIVQPLLPQLDPGKNEFKQVSVQFYDSVPAAELPPPSLPSNAFAWTSQHASSLTMAGLAVFSLLMLRSIVRGGGLPTPAAGGSPVLRLETGDHADSGAADSEDEADGRPRLKLRKGESLKDDLADMVREDPDAAAAILRSWIGQAG